MSLSADLQELRLQAKTAAERAYAPYSKFPVGAVLDLEGSGATAEGQVLGCNVENISFSMTVCAERNALAQAICQGAQPGSLRRLAIYMPGEQLYSPCGACRQFIAELMTPDAEIYAFCDLDNYQKWTPASLLPDGFNTDQISA